MLHRLTFKYTLVNGEVANNVLHLINPQGTTLATVNSAVDSVLGVWWTAMRAKLPSTVGFPAYRIDEVDIVTGKSVAGLDAGGPNTSGQAIGVTLPPQVASVITLRTGQSSRRRRGRMYLPPLSVDCVGGDGLLKAGDRDAILNATTTLFNSLNSNAALGSVAVYSRTDRVAVAITQIDMGRAFDTQRGRRNRLSELRGSAVITP